MNAQEAIQLSKGAEVVVIETGEVRRVINVASHRWRGSELYALIETIPLREQETNHNRKSFDPDEVVL